MQYTFKQACRKLAATTHAYGSADVREAVNDAIQALAGMSGWECMRRVLRIVSAQPAFALPQGCAGLVRACAAGRPVSVRGQDFEFLHSGPGDLHHPPPGYFPIRPMNIVDRGFHPLMFDPVPPFRLFALSSSADDAPDLGVKAVLASGEVQSFSLPVASAGTAVEDAVPDGRGLSAVLGVAVDECARAYVNLYAVDANGLRVRVGVYNPHVSAPRFHRYELDGAVCGGGPVDLLVEARLEAMPLVEDTDILPFDSLEPVEWMMQAAWYTKSGEIDAAQKMHSLAAGWLKAREATADTFQTPLVVNSLFTGSPGEVSMESVNI